jgi:hypothetical protein
MGSGVIATPFLTSALNGGEWSVSHYDHFTPAERAFGTHCKGGWVGPRYGLDAVKQRKISCPWRESKPGPAARSPIEQIIYAYGLTNISDIPSYMQHSFKTLFKSYYIYTMSLLNLFQTTMHTTCFDRQWSSSGVLKLFVDSAVLAFCASNVLCVVPSHIRVFRVV